MSSFSLGLHYGLPDYASLLEQPDASREPLVELRVGRLVTSWSQVEGAVYASALVERIEGRILDVVAVRVGDDPRPLVRVLTPAGIPAGSYYYDPRQAIQDVLWDDPSVVWWDSPTYVWDGSPSLRVRLFDSSHPASTDVVALLAYHLSARGQSMPALGEDLLGGIGDFEE